MAMLNNQMVSTMSLKLTEVYWSVDHGLRALRTLGSVWVKTHNLENGWCPSWKNDKKLRSMCKTYLVGGFNPSEKY